MQKLNSGALNRILLFVYILSLSTNAIAQNKNNSKETYLLPPHGNYVYGRVIEKLSKDRLVGVTIRLDGHSTGVITDINGCYVLTLPEKAVWLSIPTSVLKPVKSKSLPGRKSMCRW